MQIFEQPLTEQEIASIHKLADGIECGAKLRPQTQGQAFRFMPLNETEVLCSCALGAALECHLNSLGVTLDLKDPDKLQAAAETPHSKIMELYGVENQHITHAFWIDEHNGHVERYMFNESESLSGIIWRLNDYLYWTREEIAAWLRQLT